MFKGNFDLVANLIYSLNQFDLSPCSKLVLVALANHYPKILVKQKTLAIELGISLRSVNGAFSELREKKFISRQENIAFTDAFFAHITSKICVYQNAKSAYPCINKQHEQKNNNYYYNQPKEIKSASFEKKTKEQLYGGF